MCAALTSKGVTGSDPAQQGKKKRGGYKIQSAGQGRQRDKVTHFGVENIQAVSVESLRLKLSALGGLSNRACACKSLSRTNLYFPTHIHHLSYVLTDEGGVRYSW